MYIICWWRHLFPTFSSAFKHVRSLFPLDESLWCALIVKGSLSSSVYLSSGEVSTLICEVMFALRGGWTMHLLPQLRVRSSAADLSVKSKHSKKHVHTSALIPFNCIILQYNTGLFMHSMGLKKHLLDCIYCISEKWDSCDEPLCQNAFADLCCNILTVRDS